MEIRQKEYEIFLNARNGEGKRREIRGRNEEMERENITYNTKMQNLL